MDDEDMTKLMQKTFERLFKESKPLDPEFQKVINENYWDLFRDSNPDIDTPLHPTSPPDNTPP